MSKEKKPSSLSRRQFLKGVGSGVAGSVVAGKIAQALPLEKLEQAAPPEGHILIKLIVNGTEHRLHIEPQTTLVEVLRDHLHLTGTKVVCNHGECGACTVLLEDQAVYSCQMLAADADGKRVTTVEGLLNGEELHPLQKAFVEKDGYQCGFCTSGQIMTAQALLLKHPNPSKAEILEGMSGVLCRCAAYPKIVDSVMHAAENK